MAIGGSVREAREAPGNVLADKGIHHRPFGAPPGPRVRPIISKYSGSAQWRRTERYEAASLNLQIRAVNGMFLAPPNLLKA